MYRTTAVRVCLANNAREDSGINDGRGSLRVISFAVLTTRVLFAALSTEDELSLPRGGSWLQRVGIDLIDKRRVEDEKYGFGH